MHQAHCCHSHLTSLFAAILFTLRKWNCNIKHKVFELLRADRVPSKKSVFSCFCASRIKYRILPRDFALWLSSFSRPPTFFRLLKYRGRQNCGPQVWWILFLLLLTSSASTCLQHSRNLGTRILPAPVQCTSESGLSLCFSAPLNSDCTFFSRNKCHFAANKHS